MELGRGGRREDVGFERGYESRVKVDEERDGEGAGG